MACKQLASGPGGAVDLKLDPALSSLNLATCQLGQQAGVDTVQYMLQPPAARHTQVPFQAGVRQPAWLKECGPWQRHVPPACFTHAF
jgi:hypothetical protein